MSVYIMHNIIMGLNDDAARESQILEYVFFLNIGLYFKKDTNAKLKYEKLKQTLFYSVK